LPRLHAVDRFVTAGVQTEGAIAAERFDLPPPSQAHAAEVHGQLCAIRQPTEDRHRIVARYLALLVGLVAQGAAGSVGVYRRANLVYLAEEPADGVQVVATDCTEQAAPLRLVHPPVPGPFGRVMQPATHL